MAFNNQEQEIIRWGLQNGKSRQEVESAISNYRSGYIPPKQAQPEQSNLGSQLAERAKTFGKEAVTLGTLGTNTLTSQDFNATGQDRSLATLQGLNRAAQSPIRMAGAVGGAIGDVVGAGLEATGLDKPIGQALAPVVQSDPVQKAMEVFKSLPQDTQDVLGAIVNATNIPIVGAGAKVAGQAIDTGAKLASSGVDVGGQALSKTVGLKDTIRKTIATSNASPQLKSSAERMFMDGTGRVGNPLATYESYLTQSKNAVKDIKAEPAVSSVGADIGNAFEQVVKQRKKVGEVMGEELKNLGNVRVPVNTTGFLAQLKDSGLTLNPKTGQLTSFQGTRFAPDEITMLQSFTDSALKLGNNPTVSQIDNFIAKTRSELAFTKGKSGVMGTTNAERIINGALREMKDGLNPANNGITELSSYWNANKAYEDLSNFLEEGQSYLGKKTQTGDFAKDASLAKSSVQSILNNGKKDWLVRLEELTGKPLLDKAVLALQAMKDAGDFRGTSLLQTLSDGGVPITKSGLVDRILGYVATKGGEVVAGTPEEQTRTFLQSLMKSEAKPKTTIPTTKPKAKAGDSASKTSQSNSFIQPNSTTKEGVVNELINNPLRGSVTPSEFLPKKKVISESTIKNFGELRKDIFSGQQILDPSKRTLDLQSKLFGDKPEYLFWAKDGLQLVNKKATYNDVKGVFGLDKILKNDELFNKYPSLRNVDVVIGDFGTLKKNGYQTEGKIFLNSKVFNNKPQELQSTLIHEIQHLKQDIRGDMPKFSAFDEGRQMNATEYANQPREVDARRKQMEFAQQVGNQKEIDRINRLSGNTTIWKKANKK